VFSALSAVFSLRGCQMKKMAASFLFFSFFAIFAFAEKSLWDF
jgi:hypothetical protein